MRTALIFNPTSGSSPMAAHQGMTTEDIREHILSSLRACNIEPEIYETTEEDPGTGLAKKAARAGADIVIAAGGDGTLHAVATGLIGTNSALGIIAMGTMNNIAHSLEIPADIEKACQVIAEGQTRLIDVGEINGNIFLEVSGIGLEAALFPAAEEIKKVGFLSTIQGIMTGLTTLFSFQPTSFEATFDGKRRRRFRAVQISVCNSPYYGAHLRFAPNAVMDDGFLDVLIYRNFSKLEYLRHALSISQGKRALGLRVSRRKIKSIEIESEHPVEIHADGEQKGHTPASIRVRPGVLRVRVPEKIATGPNMSTDEKKQTKRYQRAQTGELSDEKGALNV
ncbi:MAG: diacylglycerol kinase family lipid kinase [Ktedonobacteraceae bacterium]